MTGSLVNMELKRKIKKLFLVIVFVLTFLQSGPTIQAYAFGGIGIKNEFDGLEGDGRFLGSDYRSNYKLDMEELGITQPVEKALNGLANVIFTLISIIGYLASAVFYYAMDFDLATLLAPQINQIQQTLHDGLFAPLFQYAFAASMILAIVKYARRDFIGLIEQFGKVCFIIVLSYLVITDSGKFLSVSTNITKGASVSILTGINDIDVGSNVKSYAANAAGVLWISLVHEPWKALEFGEYNYSEEDVEYFLTHSGDERQSKVASMMEGDKGPFSKDRAVMKIGQGLIILLMTSVKALVYMLVGILYFLFQGIAIFFVLMAPLILLLSLVPGYDIEILGVWVRKIMETQIGILMITFVIGFMVFFDRALQSLAQVMGWMVVLILQIAVCYGLYAFRWQVLMAFNNIQRGVQNPRLLKRQMLKSGNPYSALERQHMFNQVGKAMYKSNKSHGNNKGNYTDPNGSSKSGIPPSSVKRPNTTPPNSQNQSNERSYNYASNDVTDNWRDEWYNSAPGNRPSTQQQSRGVKTRPMLAQANGISPVQSSGRRIGTSNTNVGYDRSSQHHGEARIVGFGEVIELPDRSANSNGNVMALPDKSRPVIDQRYLLPDNSIQTPARGSNVVRSGPKVSGASFNQASVHIPRGKIKPAAINRISKLPGEQIVKTGSGQSVSRPSIEHSRLEAAASLEGVKHQPESNVSTIRPITVSNQDNTASERIERPITRQGAGETKRPVQGTSNRPISSTRPINSQSSKDKSNGSSTYNSASAKISDSIMREVKGEQSKGVRPTITKGEDGNRRENQSTVNRPGIQEKIKEKNFKPVRQTTSKAVIRQGISRQEVGKTIKTAPRVQNTTVNGLKSHEGNSHQDAVRVARKAIQIPN